MSSSSASAAESPRVSLVTINSNNVNSLRKINTVVIPVAYSEKFYEDAVAKPNEGSKLSECRRLEAHFRFHTSPLARAVFFNEVLVGAVASRIEDSEGVRRMYIMTLAVLSPYRRLGIGARVIRPRSRHPRR